MIVYGRTYETLEKARAAVGLLRANQFVEEAIQLVPPGGKLPSDLPTGHDVAYARRLVVGSCVVLVRAHFGQGELALQALNGAGPEDPAGIPMVKARNPSPFSDLFGLPTLSRRRVSFLSRVFSPRTRADWAFSSLLGMKLLSGKGAPFSSLLGLKLLSSNPTPLSSLLGLKTLSAPKRSWEKSFGFPLLTRKR
jgi:hypothetical protein